MAESNASSVSPEETSNPNSDGDAENSVTVSSSVKDPLSDDDLLKEYLIRLLTAKPAVVCKLVSKKWRFLISNPRFISSFVTRRISENDFCEHQASTFILSYRNREGKPSLLIPCNKFFFNSTGCILEFLPPVTIIGSCSDLLLCMGSIKDDKSRDYYVCNPLTKDSVVLPSLPKIDYYSGDFKFGLVCDPYYYRAPQANQYKIKDSIRYKAVCFWQVGNTVHVYTYCSETDSWKKFKIEGNLFSCDSNVVTHNCKLHWLNGEYVFSYDPFNDQLSSVDGSHLKCPELMDSGFVSSYCLGVSQNRLRLMLLVSSKFKVAATSVDTLIIWEQNEHETHKWDLKCQICLANMDSNNPRIQKYIRDELVGGRALAFNPTNKDIVYLAGLCREVNLLISCNLLTLAVEVVRTVPKGSQFFDCDNAFPIMLNWWPTPVPPRGTNFRTFSDCNTQQGGYPCIDVLGNLGVSGEICVVRDNGVNSNTTRESKAVLQQGVASSSEQGSSIVTEKGYNLFLLSAFLSSLLLPKNNTQRKEHKYFHSHFSH